MTPLRKHAILRRVKDITLGTTLSIALLNGSVLLQSCGNNRNDYDSSYEQSEPGRGVRTYITEVSPGEFRITDEQQVDPSRAGAIVNYHDGHRDTLTVEAARRLVQSDPNTSGYFRNPGGFSPLGGGLANALLFGGLGYMIGRSTAPGYREREDRYSTRFYANPGVYRRSAPLRDDYFRSPRVSRPSGGRSGFFGGSRSRGYSG